MQAIYRSRKKLIAYLVSLCIAVFSCFSFLMISETAQHDCTGEDCATCAYVETIEEGIKQLGDGVAVATATPPMPFLSQELTISVYYSR